MNSIGENSGEHRYHIQLTPFEKGIHLRLKELWQYRDLVRLMTGKTFAVTYQQTFLGPLWIILNPVISSLIYMFLFGYVAQIGTAGIPRILFYFVSSASWGVFSASLTTNAGTFVTNANLFGKVYFPRLVVPVSNMLVSIVKFCIQLIIVMGLMVAYLAVGEIHPLWLYYPLLPLLVLQLAVLGMSVGVLIASVTVKYRDLLSVVAVGINLWMYATPVVYPLSEMPHGVIRTIIMINPVTEIMEALRLIMMGEGEVNPVFYALSAGMTVLLFVISAAVFNRVERTFADTV